MTLVRIEEYDAVAVPQDVANRFVGPDPQRVAGRIGLGFEPRDRAPVDADLLCQILLLHPQ